MELIKSERSKDFNWARFSSSFVIEVTRGQEIFTSTAVAIAKDIVITAAHCVDCADEIVILIGDDYKTPESVRSVRSWKIHPEYNPRNSLYENDIAVLFLEEDLPHFINVEIIADQVTLTGNSLMERIGFGGRQQKNLRTWITPSFIAHSFNKRSLVLKDAFSVIGDSGGPIYTEEDGMLKLVGLHSTLEGDDKTYAVNLSYYKNWLDELINIETAV